MQFYHFQIGSFAGAAERTVAPSAALMAAFGIGVSSFSLKKMMNSATKRF